MHMTRAIKKISIFGETASGRDNNDDTVLNGMLKRGSELDSGFVVCHFVRYRNAGKSRQPWRREAEHEHEAQLFAL